MTINIKQIAICIILATLLATFIEWEHLSNYSTLMAEYRMDKRDIAFLRSPLWQFIITFGFSNAFIFNIYEYIKNFQRDSAFQQIIVPLMLLFLAFNWLNVLRWH